MEQLQLDFDAAAEPVEICEHRHWREDIKRVWCSKHEAWTLCHVFLWGEEVGCAWDEPDNSPEACKRRVEWLKTHKEVLE